MTDKPSGARATPERPPWAAGASLGSTGASTFRPPAEKATAKAFPQPFAPPFSRRFTAPVAAAKAAAENPAAKGLPPIRTQRRFITVLLSMLVVILVVAAGLLAWKAFTVSGPGNVAAPLPTHEFIKPASIKPVGPHQTTPVTVTGPNGTGPGTTMTASDMAPMSLFIPALGVYMPLDADTAFVASKYADFESIKIPADATRGVWYAAGGALYGSQHGTTMIASHVNTPTGWGVLRYLYTLTGGEMFYTTDAKGQLQSWKMNQMRVENHTAFPQEYWSPAGVRRLVVTTCGGPLGADGIFTQNIFAIAVPVDPQPKPAQAAQPAKPEGPAAANVSTADKAA